jgi:ankyrin repeat protein
MTSRIPRVTCPRTDRTQSDCADQSSSGPSRQSPRSEIIRSFGLAVATDDVHGVRSALDLKPELLFATDEDNESFLFLACKSKDSSVCRILIDHGCDTNHTNHRGNTPLHIAVLSGNVEVVSALLKAGADPNRCNEFGETPLHRAIYLGTEKTVSTLLENGADPNRQDLDGESSLHWACYRGAPELIRLILDSGGDPQMTDHHGQSPLDWARRNGKFSILELIQTQSVKEEEMNQQCEKVIS